MDDVYRSNDFKHIFKAVTLTLPISFTNSSQDPLTLSFCKDPVIVDPKKIHVCEHIKCGNQTLGDIYLMGDLTLIDYIIN